jgi:5-methyltetrahydropteroyltriglutamate--homocysteine methyltransferase
MPSDPEILTTTVGSYTIPDWLAAFLSERAPQDATRFAFGLQRQAERPSLVPF